MTTSLGPGKLTMLAGIATHAGLELAEIPRPEPAAKEVLIRVAAAGVNWGDLHLASGSGGPATLGRPIGSEWAGEVVAVGPGVTRVNAGDFAVASGRGGYAEYAVADEFRVIKLGSDARLPQMAVLPIALMTAHDAIATAGRLRIGETVLVHGASSAVGIACLQLAKRLGASQVLGTSRSAAHRAKLRSWEADVLVDPSTATWADEVLEATGGKGADLIIDLVSGPNLIETLRASATAGRIVNVGRLAGGRSEIDLEEVARKRLQLIGVTFRTRTLAETTAIIDAMRLVVWPMAESGEICLPIHRSFRLQEATAVHALMQSEPYFGKLVLRP